mgnify:CR=1 FL=1
MLYRIDFPSQRIQNDSHTHPDHILALNKDGVHFLDMVTHVSKELC